MSNFIIQDVSGLFDPTTGMLKGFLGANGREYYVPSQEFTASGGTVVGSIQLLNTLVVQTLNATNANVSCTFTPTGTGTVTIAPATAGTINNMSLGQTTPAAVKTSNLAATYTDSTGTPGNVTNNSPRGRVAIPAATASLTVTSSLVTAASSIQVTASSNDATGWVKNVVPAAGSFTINLGANATAQMNIDFLVVN